jgi:hypothetical protein
MREHQSSFVESPVFRMISINNDKVIEEGIRMGLEAQRGADR